MKRLPDGFSGTRRHEVGSAAEHKHVSFEVRAKALGVTWEQWQESLANRNHARRLSTLAEMANVAAFMASDKASGMTGTTVNLTMGSLDD